MRLTRVPGVIFQWDEKKPLTLSVCYLTDEYSFWTRGGVQQASMFISRVCVARTDVGKIQTVTPDGSKGDGNSLRAFASFSPSHSSFLI